MYDCYDELVKRLREQVKCNKKIYPQGAPFETLLLDLAADAIENLSKPRWIPVTEALPEATKEVIVCDKMPNEIRYVTTAWIREDCTFWNDCGKLYEATHWMPLPEPPKEEEA